MDKIKKNKKENDNSEKNNNIMNEFNREKYAYDSIELDYINKKLDTFINDCKTIKYCYNSGIIEYGVMIYTYSGSTFDELISKIVNVADSFQHIIEKDNYYFDYKDTTYGKEYISTMQKCLNKFNILVNELNILNSQIYDYSYYCDSQKEILKFKADRSKLFVDYAIDFINFIAKFYSEIVK